MHLHYVQCMLRALGEVPETHLPDRSPDTDEWVFDDWRPKVGGQTSQSPTGIPAAPRPRTRLRSPESTGCPSHR